MKPGRLDNGWSNLLFSPSNLESNASLFHFSVVYSFPKNERTQQIDWELAGKILKGGRVRLTYRGNPTFKILGFSNLSAKETKFEVRVIVYPTRPSTILPSPFADLRSFLDPQLTPKTTQPSGPEDPPPPPPRTLSVQQYYAQNVSYLLSSKNELDSIRFDSTGRVRTAG